MQNAVGMDRHGPKFPNRETFATMPNSLLPQDDRPGRHRLDQNSDQQEQWRQEHEREERTHKIQNSLPHWNFVRE